MARAAFCMHLVFPLIHIQMHEPDVVAAYRGIDLVSLFSLSVQRRAGPKQRVDKESWKISLVRVLALHPSRLRCEALRRGGTGR